MSSGIGRLPQAQEVDGLPSGYNKLSNEHVVRRTLLYKLSGPEFIVYVQN